MRINVYNPTNQYVKYNRAYNQFFDKFTEYLKSKFDVNDHRYFEDAHLSRMPIKLKALEYTVHLMECEYIIENDQTGDFFLLTVSDDSIGSLASFYNSGNFKKALIAQFLPWTIGYHTRHFSHKCEPWTYFQHKFDDLDYFWNKRQEITPINYKLYFKGTSLEDRTILNYISKNVLTDVTPILEQDYFNELIYSKLALSIDGRGEFCYRDVELFGVGVPMIRFEFLSKMHPELIPNYHYISIPRPSDMELYRKGTEQHARLLEKRYFEVIDDADFLKFISINARRYYEDNLVMEKQIEVTYNRLGLDYWLQ